MLAVSNTLFLLLIWTSTLCGQTFYPSSNGAIIKHTYYSLSYLEPYEQAEWTYYTLTPEMLKGRAKRSNRFKQDPNVSSGSAQLSDYTGSGYDRGHLVPAADMKLNRLAMNDSFLMSNMSPQHRSFNRGIWKKLEALVRSWGKESLIHIVTGGVLTNGLQEIGSNGVDVPKQYYKIIYNPSISSMIAFLLPNQKVSKPLDYFVVSVNEIENLTHIDFFPQLPDEIESKLEQQKSTDNWKM